MSTTTLSSNRSIESRASPQLENAIDTPIEAAAGMVVTEMNTPIRALARARGEVTIGLTVLGLIPHKL